MTVATGTINAFAAEPILRVGIISDNQAYAYRNDWGMHNMSQALAMLAEKKVDLLLNAGDITDNGDPDTLEMHMQLIKEHFGEKNMPLHIACAGNHDFWVNQPIQERDHRKLYEIYGRIMNGSTANPYHVVVKGYHFIAMSEDIEFVKEDYSPAMLAALEKEIQIAVAADPGKPVFVITHYPPQNTVCGSFGASAQVGLGNVLQKYPQVISLSGHTHFPLEDERSIWQREYTAISTSTLAYGVMSGFVNCCNGIVPFAREVTQMMYMEIFSDRLVIRRYNVTDKREIKPDHPWVLPMPFDAATAPYTEKRAEQRTAPVFPADAKILLRYDFGFLYVIFDAAKHDDFVYGYRIKITDTASAKVVFDGQYAGDFYRLLKHQSDRMVYRLPTDVLTPGERYRYEIFPLESFGKAGSPLILESTLNSRVRFRQDVKIYPQE